MPRIAHTLAVLAFILPLPMAAASNDGGSGGDAPDAWPDALVIAGPVAGRLDIPAGDGGDWYRIAFDPARGASVRIETDLEYFRLELRSGGGALLHGGNYWNFWGSWAYVEIEVLEPPSDLRVGILPYNARSGDYRVIPSAFDVVDAAVTALSVQPAPLALAGVEAPVGTQYLARATIANEGISVFSRTVAFYASHATTGNTRAIGTAEVVDLLPGQQREVEIVWDANGEIGDVKVSAILSTYRDVDPDDNERTIRAGLIVANTGIGADVLNWRLRQDVQGTTIVVSSAYDASGHEQRVCVEGLVRVRSGDEYFPPTLTFAPSYCS